MVLAIKANSDILKPNLPFCNCFIIIPKGLHLRRL